MARWVEVRGFFGRLVSDFRIRMPQLPMPTALPRSIQYLRHIKVGYRNAFFLERCANWVLPYWADRQENPADEAFIPRAQSSLAYNQTNRNWTVAGPAGGARGWSGPVAGATAGGAAGATTGATTGAIVDPCGLITPFRSGWSLGFWLDIDGRLYTPLQTQTLKQYLGDPVPEIHTVWQAGPMSVRTSVVSFKTGTFPWLGCTVTLTGSFGEEQEKEQEKEQGQEHRQEQGQEQQHTPDVRLLMAIRPYNPEGFAPLKSVKYTMDGFWINGQLTLLTTEFPDRVVCTDGTRGDGVRLIDGPKIYAAESSAGLAHAVAAFNFNLDGLSDQKGSVQSQTQTQAQPQPLAHTQPSTTQSQTLEVFVPLGRAKKGFRPTAVSRQVFLSDLRHEWQAQRSAAMRVTLPEQRLSEAVQASLAFALTFAENKAVGRWSWITGGRTGGVTGSATGSAFRCEQPMEEQSAERAILAAALDGWGLHRAAGEIIARMLGIAHTQPPSKIVRGSLAQVEPAIWALQKHSMYAAVADDAMLKNAYDQVTPFFPALRRFEASNKGKGSVGNRSASNRSAGRSGQDAAGLAPRQRRFWNAAALRDATLLAQRFGKTATADGLRRTYAEARAGIVKDILRNSQASDLIAIDPLGLIASDDGLAANLLENVLKTAPEAQKQGLYYNPCMSGYDLTAGFLITQCLIMMRDHQAYTSLEQLLALALPTYAWPAAVHPRTGGGSSGEGHDPLVTALFLWVIRSILLREENESLILGASFPAHWYEPGTVIAADRVPTSFGNIGYRIEADADRVELQLEGEYRYPPQNVRWDVPFAIKSAVVNDREALHREHTILLLPQTRKVVLNRE